MEENKKNSLGKRLEEIYRNGRISHAYILEGDPERTEGAAAEFAGKLVSSPADILYPEHEKPGVFAVDDIRTAVQGTIYIRPYGNARKVYILRDAELLNPQAQNALLKTIEEPPEYAVILLCTKNTGVFLETILSRCVVFSETDGLENFSAEGGELAERTKGFLRERVQTEAMIRDLVRELSKSRLYLGLVPETVRYWFRDVLYLKCNGSPEGLICKEDRSALADQAKRAAFDRIEKVFRACREAETRLDANVSPELTLEMLLNAVADCFRK